MTDGDDETMSAATNDPIYAMMRVIHENASEIDASLEQFRKTCILISPSASCSGLQPGFGVAFQALKFDVLRDSYPVDGSGGGAGDDPALADVREGARNMDPRAKRSLYASALNRIAGEAGIQWDPNGSMRVDSGDDPHFVMWRATAGWTAFDGEPLIRSYVYRLDLRDGSDQVKELEASVKPYGWSNGQRRNRSESEIQGIRDKMLRRMRAKITERAETGAKCRVIRAMCGIGSFTVEDLNKIVVIAKRVYHGKDPNPIIAAENTRAIRDRYFGGIRAMFGLGAPEGGPGIARALPAPPPRLPAPSPAVAVEAHGRTIGCHFCGVVDDVHLEGDVYVCSDVECVATRPKAAASSRHASTAPSPARPSTRPAASPSPPRASSADERGADPVPHEVAPVGPVTGQTWPFKGRLNGRPLETLSDRDLAWLKATLAEKLRIKADGTRDCPARFVADNERMIDAIDDVFAFREDNLPY